MIKAGIKSAAAAALFLCAGVVGAQAYEQFNNASVGLKDGKVPDLGSVASAYCAGKGFAGAEKFEFSGFVANGGKMNALFASVRCTMVANIQPIGNGAIDRKGGFKPDYGSKVSRGISEEIANRGAVLETLNNQIGGNSGGGNSGGGGTIDMGSIGSLVH